MCIWHCLFYLLFFIFLLEMFKYDRTSGRMWYISTEKIPKPLVRRLRVAKFTVSVFISSGLWTLPVSLRWLFH